MRPFRGDRDDELRLGASSFSDLYGRHARDLTAFFARRTFDAEASVDLVGETFAQAFTGRRRFRGSTPEEEAAYLYAIARHLVSGYWRRGHAERRALDRLGIARADLGEDSFHRIEQLAGLTTMRELLREQLAELSDEHRQALTLRVVEELEYSEVAARMGVSEDAARARVSRGLRALQRGMAARLAEEGAR